MSNEFLVVGENRTDDQWLLVQDAEGRYYSYHPRRKRLMSVRLDERWVLYTDSVHAAGTPRNQPATLDEGGQYTSV